MNHYALKSPQYGNCEVLSPEGHLMFRCSEKRANWYLDRDLASEIKKEPLTLKLKFTPKGLGHSNDPYYLQNMENRCVVCGSTEDLTRHHIVPHCYRRFFPTHYKEHKSYDVMALCVPCHREYESQASEFKQTFAIKHSIPVGGSGYKYNKELARIKGIAHTLFNHKDRMPVLRQQELFDKLAVYLLKTPTQEDIEKLLLIDPYDSGDYISHGQGVMIAVEDLQGFVQSWRQHFLDSMKPKFLPKVWDVERSV